MTPTQQLDGRLSHLPKSDGSATFACGGYIVVASVNGPIEAQRRDENPFEAIIDVAVRPAAGVGGEILVLGSVLQETTGRRYIREQLCSC